MSAQATDAPPNPARLELRRRIEWIDTDAAGIYHWMTALRLAEAAEAALHRALGIIDRTFGLMPRVSVTADFKRPLRFNDEVAVVIAVKAVGRASLTYEFEIRGPDGVASAGTLTGCLLDPETGRPTPWPDDIRRALTEGGPQGRRDEAR